MEYCKDCSPKMEYINKYLSFNNDTIDIMADILKFINYNNILCAYCESEVNEFLEYFYEKLQKVRKLLSEFRNKYGNYFTMDPSIKQDGYFWDEYECISKLEEDINEYLSLIDESLVMEYLL